MKYEFLDSSACPICAQSTAVNTVLGQRLNRSTGMWPRCVTGVTVSVIRCKRCHLHYCNPIPVPFHVEQHYAVDPSSYWRNEYFEVDPLYFAPQIEKAKQLLGFRPGMTALDIGAGVGKCILALQNAGFDAHGIEPSPTFRQCALDKFGIAANRMLLGSVEDARLAPNSFDFINFGSVLEHLVDPREALGRAIDWLRPGGLIYIEVPSSNGLVARIHNAFYRLQGTTFVTNLSPMHPPYHLYEFSVQSLERIAVASGCSIVWSEHQVATIYHLPKVLHPLLRCIMKQTQTGAQLIVGIRKPL